MTLAPIAERLAGGAVYSTCTTQYVAHISQNMEYTTRFLIKQRFTPHTQTKCDYHIPLSLHHINSDITRFQTENKGHFCVLGLN